MNKIIYTFISLLLTAVILISCGENNATAKNDKLSVVATIFPEYDWVCEILGDKAENVEVTMLLDNGVDLHSYQPTIDDIAKISDCDMFIYVGGESDGWVKNALKNAKNDKMKVINLLEVLGDSVKTEELVEGMQEEEHDHAHHHEEITEADIENRSLSDFSGEWKSLYPYIDDLGEYFEHKAEEDDDKTTTKETYIEKYKISWFCEADKISIDGNKIIFTYSDGKTYSADYKYSGYRIKTNEDGKIASVRYQFETDENGAPKYVQFNDHGHEPQKSEHFHIYFGDNGFDALMDAKNNPFFVKSALSTNEILEELMGHEHEEEKDEHVWLSLKNAKILCKAIADNLSEIDPQNKDIYSANVSAYIKKLSALDEEYKKMANASIRKVVLFGDRFPFRYLADDYGLDYYAAFVGCSAETEASFETIAFLSKKTDELRLPCVLTIEGVNHKIADTVVANTSAKNQKVLTMDSMQATTSSDVKNGATYISVMEKNLDVLREALK